MPDSQWSYTYRNGEKIPLEKRSDQFVVRALPQDLQDAGLDGAEKVSSASSRVTVPHDESEAAVDAASNVGRVDPAYYQATTGEEFLVSDRIFVTFKGVPTNDEFDAFIGHYGLAVAQRYSPVDYLLRLTPDTAMDPVELVVTLVEDEYMIASADHDLNYRASLYAEIPPSDPSYLDQWHLHTRFSHAQFDPRASARCEEAWQLLDSFGSPDIVVAVTDDGCRMDHHDFDSAGKFAGWGYFQGTTLVSAGAFDADPEQMYQSGSNHGTSCAGVVAGEVDAMLTVGAAPGCRLLPIKWESDGPLLMISDSKLLTALDYIAGKVDIVSNSWGIVPVNSHATIVRNRIRDLALSGGRRGKGILFLWAAGNDNCPIQHSASQDVPYTNGRGVTGGWIGVRTTRNFRNDLVGIPGLMHVAALASTARRSHYSNYGTGIAICAPTNNIHLYQRMQVPGLSITTTTGSGGGATSFFGGTSSATPLVAGVAALVLSANPNLSALEVASILKRSASKDLDMAGYAKTPPASYDPHPSWDVSPVAPFDKGDFADRGDEEGTWSAWFGYGRVDAPAAVAAALQLLGGKSDEEIVAESTPNLAIPDKQPAGVQDVITLNEQGRLQGIQVQVEIEHTWIGDLVVELRPPLGVPLALHKRSGSGQDKITETYTVANTPALAGLVNTSVTGDWTLVVADYAAGDVGTLKRWALILQASAAQLEAEDGEAAIIPDSDAQGVRRSLVLGNGHIVQELAVSVDITHTWIGDLRVTLTSPQGTVVLLHDRAGGSADNLIRTWRSQEDEALRVLRGESAGGAWHLHVADMVGQDVGKLNGWRIEVMA